MKKLIISLFLATLLLGLALPKKTNAQVNVQDSLALVALYNSTDGANWDPDCNFAWLTFPVDQWYGIAVDSGRVTQIFLAIGPPPFFNNCGLNGTIPPEIGNLTELKELNLSNNINLTGNIPAEIGNLTQLEYLSISNCNLTGAIPEINNLNSINQINFNCNKITDLPIFPIFQNLTWIAFAYNKLTFEDIEPNISLNGFNYLEQDSVNYNIDTTIYFHDTISLMTNVGGTQNIYQWYKNGNIINGATDSVYTINEISTSDSGKYTCAITNSIVPNLTLWRRTITLHIDTSTGINSISAFASVIVHSVNTILINTGQNSAYVTLYNVMGIPVYFCNAESYTTKQINLALQPRGILFIHVFAGNVTKIEKIINL